MSSALTQRGPFVTELFVHGGAREAFLVDHLESRTSRFFGSTAKVRIPPPRPVLGRTKPLEAVASVSVHGSNVPVKLERGQPSRSPVSDKRPVPKPRTSKSLPPTSTSTSTKPSANLLSTPSTSTPSIDDARRNNNSSKLPGKGEKGLPLPLLPKMTSDPAPDVRDSQPLTSAEVAPGPGCPKGKELLLFSPLPPRAENSKLGARHAGDGEEEEVVMERGEERRASGRAKSGVPDRWPGEVLRSQEKVTVKTKPASPRSVYIPVPDYDEDEKSVKLGNEAENPKPDHQAKDVARYSTHEVASPETEVARTDPKKPRRSNPEDRKYMTEAKRHRCKNRQSVLPSVQADGRSQAGADKRGADESDRNRAFVGSHNDWQTQAGAIHVDPRHEASPQSPGKSSLERDDALRDFSYTNTRFGTVHVSSRHERRSLLRKSPRNSPEEEEEGEVFVAARGPGHVYSRKLSYDHLTANKIQVLHAWDYKDFPGHLHHDRGAAGQTAEVVPGRDSYESYQGKLSHDRRPSKSGEVLQACEVYENFLRQHNQHNPQSLHDQYVDAGVPRFRGGRQFGEGVYVWPDTGPSYAPASDVKDSLLKKMAGKIKGLSPSKRDMTAGRFYYFL